MAYQSRLVLILSLFTLVIQGAFATTNLEFSLHKKESRTPGNTLLIIGGIQGDEPGGFMAASLVATKYKIKSGAVWVVPNLNFPSILESSRGKDGDMNRKFATINKSDPDYHAVTKIKEIILDKQVDLVLNLHDGSGFYRNTYIDKLNNPNRWGQSSIIDQTAMPSHVKFGNLQEVAAQVVKDVNQHILTEKHRFHLKNTETRMGDKEMEKALTYFAISNEKPAFANESSKSLPVHERVYYQLLAIESYFRQMGIEYERPFALDPRAVKEAMYEDIQIAFFDKRIVLDVTDVRPFINYLPLKRGTNVEVSTNNPLIAIRENSRGYKVNYGNRTMTNLYPQYFDYDEETRSFQMQVDGKVQEVPFGTIVSVNDFFHVMPKEGYRTNVIGYVKHGANDESGLSIKQKNIIRRFSVDKKGNLFRVEVYKGEKFSGMVLVDFSPKSSPVKKNSFLARK